jgi:sarcosine oxidase, subunit delta
MLLIPCPYCGPRAELEFSYGGEAQIARPKDPAALSDEQWAAYVYWRKNTKGVFAERWMHAQGCRRWFNVIRDTVSYQILGAYEAGATPPAVERKTYV